MTAPVENGLRFSNAFVFMKLVPNSLVNGVDTDRHRQRFISQDTTVLVLNLITCRFSERQSSNKVIKRRLRRRLGCNSVVIVVVTLVTSKH